jgi:pectate lyase
MSARIETAGSFLASRPSQRRKPGVLFALWALWGATQVACGSPSAGARAGIPNAPAATLTAHRVADVRCMLSGAADGWATVHPGAPAEPPSGGAAADAAHTYEVATRQALVLALSPDAVFAADGSFTSARGPDDTPKLIHVHGTLSLNTNAAGLEQTEADYACSGYDFAAYTARYDPTVYNRQALVEGKPAELPRCTGGAPTLEGLRICSSQRQRRVVMVPVGSNTTILGVGSDARIVHGTLALGPASGPASDRSVCGAPVAQAPPAGSAPKAVAVPPCGPDNIVIRNLTFEDAFDFFPAWDPTDDYPKPPAAANAAAPYPQCQADYVAATDSGPHQCPGGRWNSAYDNVSLVRATHVWIDHCTFSDGDRQDHQYPSVWRAPYVGHGFIVQHHDGLVDITSASDFVTLSYDVFRNHDKTTLVGGNDRASVDSGLGALSVTVHHNHYENAGQRMPRVRFGKVHVYANYVTGTLVPHPARSGDSSQPEPDNFIEYGIEYGMGIGYLAKLYSENNVYELAALPGEPEPDESALYQLFYKAAPTTEGGLDRDEKTYFYDRGSLLNGKATDLFASANASAPRRDPPKPPLVSTELYWKPSSVYAYELTPAAEVRADVMAHAGVCPRH